MAQTSSPSLSMPDGQQTNGHAPHSIKSDGDVPIDPSIAQSSPTYPPPHNYSPYPPQHEMPQYGAQPPMPPYGRPEWAGQYQQQMGYSHSPATSGAGASNAMAHVQRPPAVGIAPQQPVYAYPNVSQGGHPLSTVYSFVPIPGAQQHKRPRRRYEEIERMYKCGWNGCEKAYGTLNHLNAHVTMQSHGTKRTPEGETLKTFHPRPLKLPSPLALKIARVSRTLGVATGGLVRARPAGANWQAIHAQSLAAALTFLSRGIALHTC